MDSFRSISKDELNSILEKHKMWLDNKPGGEKADLYNANLRGADLIGVDLKYATLVGAKLIGANLRGSYLSVANLRGSYLSRAILSRANLRGANLRGADLSGADLSGADLSVANLSGADLSGADLIGADLIWADLIGADLSGADLRVADLSGAKLSGADLIGADLSGAKLSGADLSGAKLDWPSICPEKGSFIGYKKCRDNLIVELEIQEDALRSSATTRKCRCSKAKVLGITDLDGSDVNVEYAVSKKDSGFLYKVGEVVSVDDFDTNRWNECSTGIHFFMTREEAVGYIY